MCFAALCFGQSNPLYIQFQPLTVKGALYKPESGPGPHVAVLVIHRTANFMSHPALMNILQESGRLADSIWQRTRLLRYDGVVGIA